MFWREYIILCGFGSNRDTQRYNEDMMCLSAVMSNFSSKISNEVVRYLIATNVC